MGKYMVLVHCVGAWGTVHGLSAGHIVVIELGLQGGVVLAVVVWGRGGVVVRVSLSTMLRERGVARVLKGACWGG